MAEPEKEEWRLTFFYGEANRRLRHEKWDMMAFLWEGGGSTLSWACIGDCSEILQRGEQLAPNARDVAQMVGFREAVDVLWDI